MFAVEASDIAEHAASVVCHNNLGTVVTVLQCKMEEAVLPEKVDLIISEWMGTLLIVRSFVGVCVYVCVSPLTSTSLQFEMMLECVLLARDKWLKPVSLGQP